jgi:hypothetical protein
VVNVTELLSGPRLARVISEEFGIQFHSDYPGVWVRQRGHTLRRPQRVAREHGSQTIALWRQEDRPRIKKNAVRRGAAPALMDESGVLMAPVVRHTELPLPQTLLTRDSIVRENAISDPHPLLSP